MHTYTQGHLVYDNRTGSLNRDAADIITYIHICIHTYRNTYLHKYIHACMHTYMHTYIQGHLVYDNRAGSLNRDAADIITYIHICIHTYTIHTYINTYIHAYT